MARGVPRRSLGSADRGRHPAGRLDEAGTVADEDFEAGAARRSLETTSPTPASGSITPVAGRRPRPGRPWFAAPDDPRHPSAIREAGRLGSSRSASPRPDADSGPRACVRQDSALDVLRSLIPADRRRIRPMMPRSGGRLDDSRRSIGSSARRSSTACLAESAAIGSASILARLHAPGPPQPALHRAPVPGAAGGGGGLAGPSTGVSVPLLLPRGGAEGVLAGVGRPGDGRRRVRRRRGGPRGGGRLAAVAGAVALLLLRVLGGPRNRRPRPVDVVLGRSDGLGSSLFAPVHAPRTPVVQLFDYYYHARKHDLADEAGPETPPAYYHWRRAANAIDLLDLENGVVPWAPTAWQRDLYPAEYRDDFLVLHDGVDARSLRPEAGRPRSIAGRTVPEGAKVVTFVARCLDRLRGFDRFLKLANALIRERPDVVAVAVGDPTVDRTLDVDLPRPGLSGQADRGRPPARPRPALAPGGGRAGGGRRGPGARATCTSTRAGPIRCRGRCSRRWPPAGSSWRATTRRSAR